jgi:hypothetical protein
MDETRQIQGNRTSLAVRQFVAFVRGEDEPHEPSNPWQVERVIPAQQYCLSCCGARWFDVIQAVTVDGKNVSISRCRCCGAEV